MDFYQNLILLLLDGLERIVLKDIWRDTKLWVCYDSNLAYIGRFVYKFEAAYINILLKKKIIFVEVIFALNDYVIYFFNYQHQFISFKQNRIKSFIDMLIIFKVDTILFLIQYIQNQTKLLPTYKIPPRINWKHIRFFSKVSLLTLSNHIFYLNKANIRPVVIPIDKSFIISEPNTWAFVLNGEHEYWNYLLISNSSSDSRSIILNVSFL